MSQLEKNKATICIVNYKTLDFTRLCLRSIRKFTDYPYEIVVVDNDSNDDSLEYLRSLKWIRLIERNHQQASRGAATTMRSSRHGLVLLQYRILRRDAFRHLRKKTQLATELVSYFNDDEKIACVGSGKIELTPLWMQLLKKFTDLKPLPARFLAHPGTGKNPVLQPHHMLPVSN